MKRLICVLALLVAVELRAAWTVSADGDGVVVSDGRTESRLAVAAPAVTRATTRRAVPGDYAGNFPDWDPWPAGKGKASAITPSRDEMNTLILGGLYRAVQAETVKVTAGDKTFVEGQDYRYNPDWAQIAAIDGRLGKDELTITYTYALQRLDLVQADAAGKVSIKQGESKMVCPQLPSPDGGATAIAGVYVAPWRRDGQYVVAPEDIYPIEKPAAPAPVGVENLSRSRKLLADGQELKIAFLGDSVTLGAEAGPWWADLWTDKNATYVSRVVVALRKQYPGATVTPIHAAKGATTTKAAAGTFDQKIAPAQANLVVIAYGLNDAHGPVGRPPGNPPAKYKDDVRAIVSKCKALGAEVILVTPFQPNPFIKSGIGQRITEYRQALLDLAKEENVAAADVYTAWMGQAKLGVPPFSQLHNWINHPGPRGHAIYADTILGALVDSRGLRSGAAQPAIIPGAWEFKKPPLPPIDRVLRNGQPNPNVYGLYTWKGEYATHRDSIKKVGWKSIRLGGPIDDATMTMLASDGVEVMYTISPGKIGKEPDAEAKLLASYPAKIDEVLNRYGPGGTFFAEHPAVPNRPIRHVEICNEPNFQYVIPPDGRPQKELEAARESLYARLLPAAYAVKAKHPGVQFVGFSAGGASAGDLRFVKNVYGLDPDIAKSFDIFSTHPYVDPAPPEAYSKRSWGSYSIASSLDVLRQTIQQQPVWYTEIGWAISHADGGRYPTKPGPRVSPLLQAAYAVRLYAMAQRLGVQRVHVMFATDTDNFNGGFFLRDGAWRPSAKAVQTMIRLMPAPRLTETLVDGDDGTFVYRFGDVVMAWRVAGTKVVEIPMTGRATVTDMLGESREVEATDGKVSVEIGPLPMYVGKR